MKREGRGEGGGGRMNRIQIVQVENALEKPPRMASRIANKRVYDDTLILVGSSARARGD